MRQWLRGDAPDWAVWAVLLLLLAVVATATAQFFNPPVVTEREVEVRVVTRERVEWRERVVVETREATRWRTVTREVPVPVPVDGGVQVVVVRETVTEAVRDASASSTTDAAGEAQRAQRSEARETATSAPVLPSWRVGLQVGASWTAPAVTLQGPLVVGVEASYRLPLPLPPRYGVWAGAWGGTYGAAGASLAVEF